MVMMMVMMMVMVVKVNLKVAKKGALINSHLKIYLVIGDGDQIQTNLSENPLDWAILGVHLTEHKWENYNGKICGTWWWYLSQRGVMARNEKKREERGQDPPLEPLQGALNPPQGPPPRQPPHCLLLHHHCPHTLLHLPPMHGLTRVTSVTQSYSTIPPSWSLANVILLLLPILKSNPLPILTSQMYLQVVLIVNWFTRISRFCSEILSLVTYLTF